MAYGDTIEEFADRVATNPHQYVTEIDVQVELVVHLNHVLDDTSAEFTGSLIGSSPGYKLAYMDAVEDAFDRFNRVHTEISLQQGTGDDDWRERLDVAVFKEELSHDIEWRRGSKRFHRDDIEAAIELKFVKNKPKFPTTTKIRNLQDRDISVSDLRDVVDLSANSIKKDIEELGRLDAETYLFIFSNYNYLYQGNLADTERGDNVELYRRLGDAAEQELAELAEENNVSLIYVHPLQDTAHWITR